MTRKTEEFAEAPVGEWYAIDREQQRVLGPFRSEQECARAVEPAGRHRWDVVPLILTH